MAAGMSTTQVRELIVVLAPALLLVAGAFWLASRFVEPAPPKKVVMTTGSETGAYYAFGKRYAEILKRSGIEVEIRTSAGSVENLKRLNDPASGVDIALLQGGIANASTAPDLMSLGRLFVEPLWVFHRRGDAFSGVDALAGKRLTIGAEGSGTSMLAKALLAPSGVTAENSRLIPLSGKAAIEALLDDKADAVFLSLAPEAPLIQELLRDDRIALLSFDLADAYTRVFPYLSRVTLPKGAIDLARKVPGQDVTLVAPQAALVARNTLHPAIAGLMVDAAQEIHGKGSLFYGIGEYPKITDPEFPVSEDAERMFKNGKPFFQRFLPFWLAIFIERMLIMLVPIATIMLPLFKLVPMIYEWRIRSRLLYWYAQLKALEKRLSDKSRPAERWEMTAEIERIDEAVATIPIPLHYSDRFFELKSAIDLVRQRIESRAVRGAQS